MKGMGRTVVMLCAGVVLAAWSAAAVASGGGAGISADEAWQKLVDGNKRYLESKMGACTESTPSAREALTKGQKPYAIILSCSDSRVPPEIIFDKSMGEIFVIRVAGNVPDPIVLGSIEYAAEHLGSPLIVVLGHERCGAVTAAVDAKGKPEGNIGAIIKEIAPAVKQARKEAAGKEKAELVETAIDDNIRLVAATIPKKSPVIRHMLKEGKVKIVTAKYDLDDGKVTRMDAK
ncbi:carbonic anhydrase [Geobacter sp. AOG1]|uniref:carbonic anhydrase n=1 Tax=Geobacter sp. AOG1 TaxID=1566346 RepID=UPI001DD1BAD6|nr:carbonic anhydrase [Geobacter sp. AOG1]